MDREEAINVVKCNWPEGRHLLSEALKTLIPEFQESEDEIHRKWILEYLYDGLRKADEQFKDHFKAAIDWLEKQKEQPPAEWVKNDENDPMEIRYAGKVYKVHGIREFPGGRNGYIIEDEPGHYDCILNPDEVLGGGYGIKSNGSPYPTKDIAFSEQSAEWSEEDEDKLFDIQQIVENFNSTIKYSGGNLMPSKEYKKELIALLKSLRPQPHWKPSEEQMEALRISYKIGTANESWAMRVLKTLYSDLNKL